MKRIGFSFPLYKLILSIFDIAILNIAMFFTLFLMNGFGGLEFISKLFAFIPISAVIVLILTYLAGVHRISWRYSGFRDVARLALTIFVASLISVVFTMLWVRNIKLFGVVEVLFISLLATCICTVARVLIRHIRIKIAKKKTIDELGENGKMYDYGNTLIIGAGNAGEILIRRILFDASFVNCKPVAIIDDDPTVLGTELRGVRVVGNRDSITSVVKKKNVKTIFFAIPSATTEARRDILGICAKTGCDVRVMQSFHGLLEKNGSKLKMRKVKISDLLGRDAIKIDVNKILGYVENRTILVTGGGGSIGSELCRQIATHNPKKLIIFDIYENSTYDIINELKRKNPKLDVLALIGSVRDVDRLDGIFKEYRPDIVYHAAAHKHVPLMEDSPQEAIKNNIFGTFNTVRMADKYGVKRFVMISTDKAVNPTNIMGATKRACEMIIQTYNNRSKTEYVAVRFGNVLGSNGSVIPLFEKQIEEGGPVTVTHHDIIRYFMTIPEAVSLVLSAGAFAKGGEIFVLDMGEPVRILDLAENMIRLSGYEPYKDIDIEFTGLRPGEKLYEELLMDEEGLTKTENSLIYIGKPIDFDEEKFLSDLEAMARAMVRSDCDARAELHKIVPTFKERVNN